MSTLKENRQGKVLLNKDGKGYLAAKVSIPTKWINELCINSDDRNIELSIDNGIITIKKVHTAG